TAVVRPCLLARGTRLRDVASGAARRWWRRAVVAASQHPETRGSLKVDLKEIAQAPPGSPWGVGCDSRMSRHGLNTDRRTRHEVNGSEPARCRRLAEACHDDSVCPRLICPIAKSTDAIVFGERKLRVAREEPKLTDLSKLDVHGGCGVPAGTHPPLERRQCNE